jgi:hypothetical protein
MHLNNFQRFDEDPITAKKIHEITEVDYRFMKTMFAISAESGKIIRQEINNR